MTGHHERGDRRAPGDNRGSRRARRRRRRPVARRSSAMRRGWRGPLAGVVNVLDPDVIVLGGGLSNLTGLYERVPASLAALGLLGPRRLPRSCRRSTATERRARRGHAWLWSAGGRSHERDRPPRLEPPEAPGRTQGCEDGPRPRRDACRRTTSGLRDKQNPEVAAYLEAENAYARRRAGPALEGLPGGAPTGEMSRRIKETDAPGPPPGEGAGSTTRACTEQGQGSLVTRITPAASRSPA